MWHRGLRRLPEKHPSRWRWLPEKLPRRLKEKVMTRFQNPLLRWSSAR
jgi:hypothetical protein